MPVVHIKPSGISFEVEPQEAVMAAAIRHGYRWPTVCGGRGICTTCHLIVLGGLEHVCPPEPDELEVLAPVVRCQRDREASVRLACRTRITGSVTIFKRGMVPLAGVVECPQPPIEDDE